AVMEVSSSALELYRVNDVDFDIVAFNNFSREHIDQHGSLEKYYEAKSSLVRNAKKGSFAILNRDDEMTYGLRGETEAKVVTFSTKDESADLYCSDLDLSSGRAKFVLKIRQDIVGLEGMIEKGEYPVNLKVPGFHSVVNSLSAMAMALVDGVKIRDVIQGVETFGGVERRFQYIYDDEFVIIDDHFANMSNIDMTLESLVKLDYNKLHLVYAIRGNRGPTVNRENILTLLKWRDKLHMDEIIGTKSVEFVSSKDKVTEVELTVFHEELKKSDLKVTMFDDLESAIRYGIDKAEEGDVILLAGSQGMDYGARVALQYIYSKNEGKDKEKLFAPLKGRVSDMA
ncbi:MAG TPA: Mur ligase family protein, partial [Bacteroidales bacterium]|nr:Mur ligase family protein [Bacteroidales bacterium]